MSELSAALDKIAQMASLCSIDLDKLTTTIKEAEQMQNTYSTTTTPYYADAYATTTSPYYAVSSSGWNTTSDVIINGINTNEYCKKSECPYNNQKKEKKMMLKNLDFGPCTDNNVRMSPYGLAVKNTNGSWVSYNKDTNQVIDVDDFNFDGRKFLYKMPVALDKVAVGDVVIHNRYPMFVTSIEGGIHVVDAAAGEAKTILPITNIFGFNFVVKVVSLLDMAGGIQPTADQPFGNMLPLMMMDDTNDNLAMMMLMSQNMKLDMSNPMMMYCLMKDNNNNMLPLFMMMQNQNQNQK